MYISHGFFESKKALDLLHAPLHHAGRLAHRRWGSARRTRTLPRHFLGATWEMMPGNACFFPGKNLGNDGKCWFFSREISPEMG